jgi:hypothetical protein
MELLISSLIYLVFFFLVYKTYYFFRGRKNKQVLYKTIEVLYLGGKYKLDVKKIGLKKLLNVIALSNAIIFTITILLSLSITNPFFKLLVMFVILFPLIYITYLIVGKYYIKKGMTKSV